MTTFGKVANIFPDETFTKGIILLNEYFNLTNIIKESTFPGESGKIYLFSLHECSVERLNFNEGFFSLREH